MKKNIHPEQKECTITCACGATFKTKSIKDNIQIEMENGYLKVTAKVENSKDDEEEGRYIHKERFYGECSRSFYVGDNVSEEDVKASFKNGILTLTVPKEEQKKLEEKKFIQID